MALGAVAAEEGMAFLFPVRESRAPSDLNALHGLMMLPSLFRKKKK
jgi:hypothetical protein